MICNNLHQPSPVANDRIAVSIARAPLGRRGFSIPEFMVAMTITLILSLGAIQILVSGKEIYRAEDAQARMQETGRFGSQFLGFELRMAGFMGCPNLRRLTPKNVALPAPTVPFDLSNFVRGYEASAGAWSPALPASLAAATTGTDVISVQRAANCSVGLTNPMATDTSSVSVPLANTCGFAAQDVVIVSDCVSADIFKVSGTITNGGNFFLGHGTATNSSGRLSKAYGTDAQISKLQSTSFYVAPAANGEPSLWQLQDGAALELVEGVQDLQILYGTDDNDDLAVDRYVTADTPGLDMGKVLSVRLGMLVRSTSDFVTPTAQTYLFNGVSSTATDKRMRRVFTTTVNLRDRTL